MRDLLEATLSFARRLVPQCWRNLGRARLVRHIRVALCVKKGMRFALGLRLVGAGLAGRVLQGHMVASGRSQSRI